MRRNGDGGSGDVAYQGHSSIDSHEECQVEAERGVGNQDVSRESDDTWVRQSMAPNLQSKFSWKFREHCEAFLLSVIWVREAEAAEVISEQRSGVRHMLS